MLNTMRYKPPGLPWSGQFVLPLTVLGIPADIVLRLSVAVAVAGSLWLLGLAARRLDFDPRAVLGLQALVAGTPMLQSLASDYMTEAPQVVVVSWFLFIMASAPGWDRGFLLIQLALATLTAVLIKSSSPFYICLPAAAAVWSLLLGQSRGRQWVICSGKTLVAGLALLIMALPATHWFVRHYSEVLEHMRNSASGTVGAAWGKTDTYLNTLGYWLEAFLGLFPFLGLGLAGLLIGMVGLRQAQTGAMPKTPVGPMKIWAVVCLVQIILVLMFAGMSTNRLQRFLLPLLPYTAVLTAWCFSRIFWRGAPALFAALGLIWWLGGSLVSLGILPGVYDANPRLSFDGGNRRLLEDVVQRTSADAPKGNSFVTIAVDPVFFGDWMAPEPANYAAWKLSLEGGQRRPQVSFRYAGNHFFGASPEETLRDLMQSKPRFVLAADPDLVPPEKAKLNRSLQGENGWFFFRHLMESGRFAPPKRLELEPRLLLFQSVESVGKGR